MIIDYIINNKPLLVGLHLGFAILAIDGFIWLFGEILGRSEHRGRIIFSAILGLAGLGLSWLTGGYYYVKYYGTIVKPIIKAGGAPWAHAIAMEAKEHIFLFLIPIAVTVLLGSMLDKQVLYNNRIRKPLMVIVVLTALVGLSLGAMGFIISAAARWGGI